MSISFIVPLFNEVETITQCLAAIKTEMSPGDEVIVVDNGSDDGSLEAVLTLSEVRLIESSTPEVSGVRNSGARVAKGDCLAFIDADCTICTGWRIRVVEALSSPTVAATGSKVAVPDEACWIEKAWFAQRRKGLESVNYINSGNLVVKRTVFDEVGGFNESLKTGEDAELCMKITLGGGVILEDPAARSIHLDNPKTLRAFFNKQRWHGLGMFGTFRLSYMDKPLIMTVYFIISLFIALVFAVNIFHDSNWIFTSSICILILFSGPVVTAMFRAIQFRTLTHFPHLVVLYFIFYTARASAMLELLVKKSGHSKKRMAT